MKLFRKGAGHSSKKTNEKGQSSDNISIHSVDSEDGSNSRTYQLSTGDTPPVPPKEVLDVMFNDVAVCLSARHGPAATVNRQSIRDGFDSHCRIIYRHATS